MSKICRGDIIEFRDRYAIVLEKTKAEQIIFVPVELNIEYNHRALFIVRKVESLSDESLMRNGIHALCIIGRSPINGEMKICGHLHSQDIDDIEAVSVMEYNTRRSENTRGGSFESPLALSVGVMAGSASVWNGKRAPTRRASL
ncbi:hypothetical protein [Acetobacter fallax]|uniref:Uncharacterized protein n=1 Tax=Acetobacter fallax TaxID=1737473 RepID=A0ABX0KBH7_9PROT|nr:hypothetical protein [Acetobacter fallax]NHO33789.1 hypothetical protein [Acetobacter fallax]NHO37350.1 hypothetical protein [Acetobacter fallax]